MQSAARLTTNQRTGLALEALSAQHTREKERVSQLMEMEGKYTRLGNMLTLEKLSREPSPEKISEIEAQRDQVYKEYLALLEKPTL